MTDDIIRKATTADYIETIDNLRAEVKRLRAAVGVWEKANSDLIAGLKAGAKEVIAKAARIKELEEMIRQLGSLAFMGDMPLDQIVAHFIAWGQSNYDYTSRLEAAFLDSLAARLYYEHYPGVSDAYSWHDYPEDACHCMPKEKFRKKAREALARIKEERKG